MIITFHNQEEKEEFIKKYCPSDIGINIPCSIDFDYHKHLCTVCWERTGVLSSELIKDCTGCRYDETKDNRCFSCTRAYTNRDLYEKKG